MEDGVIIAQDSERVWVEQWRDGSLIWRHPWVRNTPAGHRLMKRYALWREAVCLNADKAGVNAAI